MVYLPTPRRTARSWRMMHGPCLGGPDQPPRRGPVNEVSSDAADEDEPGDEPGDGEAADVGRPVDARDPEAGGGQRSGGDDGGVDLQLAEERGLEGGQQLPEQLLEAPVGDDDRDDLQRQERG